MKKRFVILTVLILCFALLPHAANAASSGTCGPNAAWTLDSTGLMTVSGTGGIDSYAFTYNTSITKLKIQEGITAINDYSFHGCYNLTSVSLPSTLTAIGQDAFSYCTSLTAFTIPNGVTWLGSNAFNECSSLKSVTIPNSVTEIREKTFFKCTSLTSVTIPSSVTSIGSNAFYYCNSLTSLTLSNGVKSLETAAFDSCGRLTKVTLPNSVTSIGMSAFSRCSSLTSVTVMNDNANFNYWVFSDCPSSLTIYCRPGSTAQQYASENNIKVSLIGDKPVISAQPSNISVAAGNTATFKVTASGATGYQWYYRKSSSGAWNIVQNNGTSAAYKLTTTASHNGYQFRCLVKNSVGSVYSNTVTLTVNSKPVITAQPGSLTVSAGAVATFKVTATGATSYQWYYRTSSSGTWNIVQNNGTSATYNLTTIASHNGYQFRCLVKNNIGSVYTNTVTLTVNNKKPSITTYPNSRAVYVGSTATFSLVATGATSYQWYYRAPDSDTWIPCTQSSATSDTLNIFVTASLDLYEYRCEVKNSAGSIYCSPVTLGVINAPDIIAQPASQTVNAGDTASFSFKVRYGASWQWYYRKTPSSEWISVKNNGTTVTYKLATAASHNGYQFRCLVKNSLGSVYSNIVTLTVK